MRFCGNCGSALDTTAAAAEERKLVTVLFADVVASTALAGAIDPERLRTQMARFFDIAREEIERYGGTVEKFIGDAVMAVFGLPAIHEDDPARAARAAAAIRDRLQPLASGGALPPIRIGLATGEVVANPRAAEKGEFLVTGEVVNLAARLQQHAAGGQILATERTMQALRSTMTLHPVAPLTVKGRADPLPAWELGAVPPPGEREVRATPFVGRDEELGLLAGHARRMRREGRGHVVTILGPAGVGKTRLVAEFRQRAADVHSLRGRALPYGTGVPLWAVGEVIREECGILFGDPLEAAHRKVEDTAGRLQVDEVVPALRSALGLGDAGRDVTREELFAGMRAFFQAVARRAPLLVILEDIHSAEDVTLDFLEHSADWIREVPVLLLVLSRPELLERRPSWMGGKRSASTLSLDPLGGEESRALALGILDNRPASEPLVDKVLTSAEGNPLFMEEMLRSLIERGVLVEEERGWVLTVPLAEVAIPDTVHAVIAARVDALPGAEKQVLQVAAVQGKDFFLGGIHFLATADHVDETLAALIRKELIFRKPRSVVAGDEEYTFRHILIRDVAYALIPKAQRWPRHARIAEWMSETAGDRLAEWADFIAHHWLQVVGLRQELGLPADERARRAAIANLLLAGERAARVYANTTALDHFTRAVDLHPGTEERLRALLGRGEVWFLLGQYDQARADFNAARDLARPSGLPRWEAVALDRLGYSFRQQDEFAAALEHLERALAISREAGDPALSGHILNHIGFTYFAQERHPESIAAHEEARRLLGTVNDRAGLAESLHGLGDNLIFLGRYAEAIKSDRESIALCEELGNRSLAAENRYMIAYAQQLLGAYAPALAEAERALATLTEIGDARNACTAHYMVGRITATLGNFGTALASAARGLSLARELGAKRMIVYHMPALARVYRELEDFRSALQADTEAVRPAQEVARSWGSVVHASLALDFLGLEQIDEAQRHLAQARQVLAAFGPRIDTAQEVAYAEGLLSLAGGRPAEALRFAQALAALGEPAAPPHWRVPALLLEAEAAAALKDRTTAISLYLQTAEEAERSGQLPLLWRALAGLAEVQRDAGTPSDAVATARRARETIERLAATLADERLRAVFLQSPRVQRVVALAGT
jgi:class 3 adenylate cyclase/tetratricopeptide (TPR) repeat protein